jgi:DNA polymerase-3 subunit beta
MDVTIGREELTRGLQRVQGIIERRTTNPALAHVLLEASGERLRLTATDTLLTLVADYPAQVAGPGELSVDAATLFQVSKALNGEVVHLRTNSGNRLSVRSGTAEFNILAGSPDEFPPLPTQNDKAKLQIQGRGLRRIIEETLFSVSGDENRYGLNGAHFEEVGGKAGNTLRLVTTDGSRLSYSETPYEGQFGMGRKMLLPKKALGEIRKMVEADDSLWTVAFGDRSAVVSTPGLTLIVRLVEGEFPDYRQVLPQSFKRHVEMNRDAFDKALRNVVIMASDRNHLVRFSFESDRVVLSAANVEAGDVRAEVEADVQGTPLLTGFNVKYFQDILSNTRGDRISLDLGDTLDPCIVRLPGRDDCLFVVMPMRLD